MRKKYAYMRRGESLHGSLSSLSWTKQMHEQGADAHDQMISLLYEAVLTPALWTAAMEAVSDVTASLDTTIVVHSRNRSGKQRWEPQGGVSASRLFTPDKIGIYLKDFGTIDPLPSALQRIPAGSLTLGDEFFDEAAVSRCDFHQGFLLPCGGRYTAVCKLENSPHRRSISPCTDARRRFP
jgi:hypothetical protein